MKARSPALLQEPCTSQYLITTTTDGYQVSRVPKKPRFFKSTTHWFFGYSRLIELRPKLMGFGICIRFQMVDSYGFLFAPHSRKYTIPILVNLYV